MSRFSSNVEVHGDALSAVGLRQGRLMVRPADNCVGPAVDFFVDGNAVFRIHEDLLTLIAQAFGGKP